MILYLSQFLLSLIGFGLFLVCGLMLAQAIKEKSFLGITLIVTLSAAYLLMVGYLLLHTNF